MVIGYDLGHYPITFDFVYWLVKAEEARIKVGAESLSIVIQPGPYDGFRLKTVRDFQLTADRKRWRLENLILPLAHRVPSVSSVTIAPVRMEKIETPHFNIFTDIHKNPTEPFRASLAAKAAVQAMYPDPFVTITLRDSDIQPTRNSNQEEWRKVRQWLEKETKVVVVPDTEAVLQGRKQSVGEECTAAALNIDLRLALYEQAKFSCFTSGGPMTLAQYDSEIRYAIFKLLCTDEAACTPKHLNAIGLTDGATRGNYRNAWWCDDSYKNVIEKLDDYKSIKYSNKVDEVLRAQTHFRGQLIQPVPHG